jgi:hypothetical protein
MISPAFRYSDPNIQVTIQAFLIGNLIPKGMAFGTIREAFEMGVGLRKISW